MYIIRVYQIVETVYDTHPWSFQQTYQSTNRYDSLKTNQADTPPPHTRRRMASCFLVIRYCTGAYTSLSNPTHYRSALRNSSFLHSTHHLNMSRMSLVSYLLPLLPSTYVQYDHEHDKQSAFRDARREGRRIRFEAVLRVYV